MRSTPLLTTLGVAVFEVAAGTVGVTTVTEVTIVGVPVAIIMLVGIEELARG